MENHHFAGKIEYTWPFSIAMLVYQRVVQLIQNALTWYGMIYVTDVHPKISKICRVAGWPCR
jgi:hypothetical protein